MSHGEEEILGKAYDSRLTRRLLHYLDPYRRHVAGAVALTIAGSALQLVGPYLTKIAIDRTILRKDLHGLNVIALLFLAFLSAQFVLIYAQNIVMTWIFPFKTPNFSSLAPSSVQVESS